MLLLAPSPVRAEPDATDPRWGLPNLMRGLASVRSGAARFTERKYLSVMTQPLNASGLLHYTAPDRLEKETLLPQPSRLVIEADLLIVTRGGEPPRTLSLRDTPEIAGLVEGVRATMAGDLRTLERLYTLTLKGDADGWVLLLEPQDRRVRNLVTSIRITGHHNALTGVETLEHDGDRTEMTIEPHAS